MSRHRFIKNIDLDEEMASDSGEEEGMTEEDAAALKLSFSLAKPLLADLQPPIPDDSIRESLWHYYFDVDKAVNYLRKERQKGILAPLKPVGERKEPVQTAGCMSGPPISAVQRLIESRKAAQSRTPENASPALPSASTSTTSSPEPKGKPLSKLAQLAAQRKAAATAKQIELPQRLTVDSTISSDSKTPAPSASQAKPVSKLAQRIAAAKAAKASAEAKTVEPTAPSPPLFDATFNSTNNVPRTAAHPDSMKVDSVHDVSPLFTFPSQLERNLPDGGSKKPFNLAFSSCGATPSTFFTLLTAPPKSTELIPGDLESEARKKKKQRTIQGSDPFEALDPDEVVMKAREGTRLSGGVAGSRK
ncbi:hypothetical protein QFC19_003629 [Naganishia cerealis]|uniref:Uncharacterized protein n=1 Tax=Naganishia cerealis TaxID=610337 RepID=A0ACC2W1I0_9TREE|nr:hypothetical protein QFC19_003629 [Naganishia cerealis]